MRRTVRLRTAHTRRVPGVVKNWSPTGVETSGGSAVVERRESAAASAGSATIAVTCPHCDEEIEVRIDTQAAVAPLVKFPFATVKEFSLWLRASALSIEEFQRLPVYESHRGQLEPLVRALAGSS
jgi:hypothetical protein